MIFSGYSGVHPNSSALQSAFVLHHWQSSVSRPNPLRCLLHYTSPVSLYLPLAPCHDSLGTAAPSLAGILWVSPSWYLRATTVCRIRFVKEDSRIPSRSFSDSYPPWAPRRPASLPRRKTGRNLWAAEVNALGEEPDAQERLKSQVLVTGWLDAGARVEGRRNKNGTKDKRLVPHQHPHHLQGWCYTLTLMLKSHPRHDGDEREKTLTLWPLLPLVHPQL